MKPKHDITFMNSPRDTGYRATKLKPETSQVNIFKYNRSVFVDDSAYLFGSREDMINGMNFLVKPFEITGLIVHLGKSEKVKNRSNVFSAKILTKIY